MEVFVGAMCCAVVGRSVNDQLVSMVAVHEVPLQATRGQLWTGRCTSYLWKVIGGATGAAHHVPSRTVLTLNLVKDPVLQNLGITRFDLGIPGLHEVVDDLALRSECTTAIAHAQVHPKLQLMQWTQWCHRSTLCQFGRLQTGKHQLVHDIHGSSTVRGALFTDAFAELHLRTMYLLPVVGNGYAQLLTDRFSVAFFQVFHFNGGAPMVRQ